MKNNKSTLNAFFVCDSLNDFARFFLRLFVAMMMLTHGMDKMEHFHILAQHFPQSLGMSRETSLFLITMVEVGGPIFLILGLITRLAVIPLMFAMSVAAFFTFPHFSMANSELAIMYLGIYITIFLVGPGRYSLDHYIFGTKDSNDE